MLVEFDALPDSARVWVYQADKPLSKEQEEQISASAVDFLHTWEAHGAPLTASFRIRHHRFLIIAVDERANAVTGCSTDDKVRFVQKIQQEAGVNFFDRTRVAFLVDNQVHLVHINDLKKKKVAVQEDTVTFNNLVNTKGQLGSDWLQPAGKSWLARFI